MNERKVIRKFYKSLGHWELEGSVSEATTCLKTLEKKAKYEYPERFRGLHLENEAGENEYVVFISLLETEEEFQKRLARNAKARERRKQEKTNHAR